MDNLLRPGSPKVLRYLPFLYSLVEYINVQFLLVHYANEISYMKETMRGNVLVSKSTCDEFSSIRAMTLCYG